MSLKRFFLGLILAFSVFSFGCFDINDDKVTSTGTQKANALVLQTNVPTSALTASIRTALIPQDIKVTINGTTLTYNSTSGTNMIYRVSVDSSNSGFSSIISAGGGTASLTVQVGSKNPVTISISLDTTTSGSTSKNLEVTLNIATNAGGTYTVSATGGSGVSVPTSTGTSSKSLGVKSIEYRKSDGTFAELANAVGVASTNTTLKITFDALVQTATTSFQITARGASGSTVTLGQSDISSGLLQVSQNDSLGYSYLLVTLVSNTKNGKQFRGGSTYTLTYSSSSVKRADDSSVGIYSGTSIARTFTTS